MAQRYTITDKKGFSDTRVFRVLAQSEVERPWDGRDVWANQEGKRRVCRCTECSCPTVTMLASCAHACAVQRHLSPAEKDETHQSSPPTPELQRDAHYQHLLQSLLCRHPGIPRDIVSAAITWKKDEVQCPLYLFWSGRPVDPASLGAAAKKALEELPSSATREDRDRLARLADFADNRVRVCEAAMALQKADAALVSLVESKQLAEFDLTVLRGLARRHST